MNFASDNAVGAHPQVLQAIAAANDGAQHSYGEDDFTNAGIEALAGIFETDPDTLYGFPVATGTAANALAVAATTPPYGVVLCHPEAHIATDEAGACQFFSGGAELRKVNVSGPKLTPEEVEAELSTFNLGVHGGKPTLLSITNATELGLVYTTQELTALADLAHSHNLTVHLDCARGANAVVALDTTWAEMTFSAGVDVVSFGGTKNGALALEVLLTTDSELAEDLTWRRKNSGQLLSKGRFYGAQLQAYLEGGLWHHLAAHANAAAAELAKSITKNGGSLPWGVTSNEVFAVLPDGLVAHLMDNGVEFYEWPNANDLAGAGEGRTLSRFVASWATTPDDLAAFDEVMGAWGG